MNRRTRIIGGMAILILTIGLLFAGGRWRARSAERVASPVGAQQVEIRGDAISSGGTNESKLLVAVVVLAVGLLASVLTSFWLYRWRKILLPNKGLMLPEEVGQALEGVGRRMSTMADVVTHSARHLEDRSAEAVNTVKELQSAFLTLQRSLDEKDAELRRFKAGYDRAVFDSFLKRFLRVHDLLDDSLREGRSDVETMEKVSLLLADAFDDCGLEAFRPEVGSDFASSDGVADHPRRIPTTDPALDRKIIEVIESGFRCKTPDGYSVVRPARVSVGVFERDEQEEKK